MADINEMIGGYRLRSLLQTGQTSQVFEVVEAKSNRHFAMKLLLPEAAEKPELMRRLEMWLKDGLEPSLQLYHEPEKDRNTIRRL